MSCLRSTIRSSATRALQCCTRTLPSEGAIIKLPSLTPAPLRGRLGRDRSRANEPTLGRRLLTATKIIGLVLLVAGILGLVYGHFEYTKETHQGQFGPFSFSVAEK